MSMPMPANEAERLVALESYAILDTPRELAYDELNQLAARICRCPIAYVNLMEATRSWFKATCGLPADVTEMPRELSFCTGTICQADLVVVPDLTADERFRDFGMVRGEPYFRFYCGMPLINPQGYALGTICVMDFEPRELDFEQKEALRALAHQVVGQLELRRHFLELSRSVAELQRTRQALAGERDRSERLLANMLPEAIARELKEKDQVEARFYPSATVLFTDFHDFTQLAMGMEPARLVQALDQHFGGFDAICDARGLEKLKTIGDAYMCAGGLPEPNRTHPTDCCLAALQMRAHVARLNRERERLRLRPWQMRIGIHTGPVMAGVVGRRRLTYDVWGNAVNLAARMESSGLPGRINLSEDIWHRVERWFEGEPRGSIEAKNRGRLDMFFLERIRPEFSADEAGSVPNERLLAELRAS